MRFLSAMTLCAALLAASGCGDKTPVDKRPPTKQKDDDHEHGPGPNGGVVFDLGKYHAEFTVDHGKKTCSMLILGDDMKTTKAIDCKDLTIRTKEATAKDGKKVAPMTIKLKPSDEKDGKATTFTGTDPGLGTVADFAGTVLGEIAGKPVEGEFKE